jgi:hypothetical protein
MRIRPRDLEAKIAKRLREAEEEALHSGSFQALPDSYREVLRRRRRAEEGLVVVLFLTLSVLGFSLSVAFQSILPIFLACVLFLPVAFLLHGRIQRHFAGALLHLSLEKAVRTPIERDYAEIVYELSNARGETEEATARSLLKQVNRLLESGRQLEQRRADIRRAVGEASLPSLEAERADLLRRAAQAQSSEARQALEQSAAMCAGRIESVRALHALDERLSAQLELVSQTLASVRTSFAHLRNAPEGIGGPSVEQISETVAGIQGQTRAVEQAVEEVMQLRVR